MLLNVIMSTPLWIVMMWRCCARNGFSCLGHVRLGTYSNNTNERAKHNESMMLCLWRRHVNWTLYPSMLVCLRWWHVIVWRLFQVMFALARNQVQIVSVWHPQRWLGRFRVAQSRPAWHPGRFRVAQSRPAWHPSEWKIGIYSLPGGKHASWEVQSSLFMSSSKDDILILHWWNISRNIHVHKPAWLPIEKILFSIMSSGGSMWPNCHGLKWLLHETTKCNQVRRTSRDLHLIRILWLLSKHVTGQKCCFLESL